MKTVYQIQNCLVLPPNHYKDGQYLTCDDHVSIFFQYLARVHVCLAWKYLYCHYNYYCSYGYDARLSICSNITTMKNPSLTSAILHVTLQLLLHWWSTGIRQKQQTLLSYGLLVHIKRTNTYSNTNKFKVQFKGPLHITACFCVKSLTTHPSQLYSTTHNSYKSYKCYTVELSPPMLYHPLIQPHFPALSICHLQYKVHAECLGSFIM